MLSTRPILALAEAQVADVSCRHPRGRGRELELASTRALVFVRRGCFVRSVAGSETMLDSTLAYCMNPGEAQRFDHPHSSGDDCTWIMLDERLFASLWGGEPTLPAVAIASSSELDLEHRLLLAGARRGADQQELLEAAIALTAHALARIDCERVESGRPHTARARRALVDGAREMLAVEPERSLTELAKALSVSPHHLSRVFSAHVGHTIARHRMRLRARGALERLSGGERDLARLAAELGFADQSHLTRVLRRETHHTPAALRSALA
jgi:AraC-like DNA-binding protein